MPLALAGSRGLHDHEVGRELDLPGRVPRRLVDIRDDGVALVGGIDQEVQLPGELLVRAGLPEGASSRDVAARGNLDARDLGVDEAGKQSRQQRRQCSTPKGSSHDLPP